MDISGFWYPKWELIQYLDLHFVSRSQTDLKHAVILYNAPHTAGAGQNTLYTMYFLQSMIAF